MIIPVRYDFDGVLGGFRRTMSASSVAPVPAPSSSGTNDTIMVRPIDSVQKTAVDTGTALEGVSQKQTVQTISPTENKPLFIVAVVAFGLFALKKVGIL